MNKLNERLTLIANLSVVVGIIFLGVELQQNTQAIQAQTRDSVTEKQMEYYGWRATSPELSVLNRPYWYSPRPRSQLRYRSCSWNKPCRSRPVGWVCRRNASGVGELVLSI